MKRKVVVVVDEEMYKWLEYITKLRKRKALKEVYGDEDLIDDYDGVGRKFSIPGTIREILKMWKGEIERTYKRDLSDTIVVHKKRTIEEQIEELLRQCDL